MKAIVNYGKGDLDLVDVPDPSPEPGRVLIKVLASSICGGDYSMARYSTTAGAAGAHRRRGEGAVPGHEYAGEVVAADDPRLEPRAMVAVEPNTRCMACESCRRGRPLCENKRPRAPAIGGGYAQYALVEPYQCHVLPAGLDPVDASMIEPTACCLYATERVGIDAADVVLIIGAGANAQLFIQIAKIKGAAHVAIADDIQARLRLAATLGADTAIDTGSPEGIKELESLYGTIDVVMMNRGRPHLYEQAVTLCRPGGRILCYGVAPAGENAPIQPHLLWRKEISIVGSRSYAGTFGRTLNLIAAGRIQVRPIVDRIVGLEEVFGALRDPHSAVKTAIRPWQ